MYRKYIGKIGKWYHRYLCSNKNSIILRFSYGRFEYVHASTIGQKVRAYRMIKELSQEQFAQILDLSPVTLSRIENDIPGHYSTSTIARIEDLIAEI